MKLYGYLLAILLFATPGFADTIYVPDHYASIQSAIDASLNGDTILVRDGTYVENISYEGKGIILQSENGPEVTVIDGNQAKTVVTMRGYGNTTVMILDGFTITHGYSEDIDGGGIYIVHCLPEVRNCIITDNFANRAGVNFMEPDSDGGGIYCGACDSGIISDCTISNNTTDFQGRGGGICVAGSPVTIENCLITGNVTGRGLHLHTGSPDLYDGDGGAGAGICSLYGAVLTIRGCTITNNRTGDGGRGSSGGYFGDGGPGGGIYGSHATIEACIIANNQTGDAGDLAAKGGDGGGIFCQHSVIKNCAVLENRVGTQAQGGGIYCDDGLQSILNCTVRGNQCDAGYEGGGVYGGPQVRVQNSIFWGNQPDQINPIYCHLEYSTIQDGAGQVWFDPNSCLDTDPLFASPTSDDFHLSWRSPCINQGSFTMAPLADLEGDPRPEMGSIDMGADEFHGVHPLQADRFSVSGAGGGTIYLAVAAGPENAGQYYLVLGTRSGTIPGSTLPNGLNLPVNWDSFTDLVLGRLNTAVFSNFLGVLDGAGQRTAVLNIPPLNPTWVGKVMHFAVTLDMPQQFVSNPIPVEVLP